MYIRKRCKSPKSPLEKQETPSQWEVVKPSTVRTKSPTIWNSLAYAGQQGPCENSSDCRERHLELFEEKSGSVGNVEKAESYDSSKSSKDWKVSLRWLLPVINMLSIFPGVS